MPTTNLPGAGFGSQICVYQQMYAEAGLVTPEGRISKSAIPLPQLVVKAADHCFPDLMKYFYPRCYEHLGNYHSPKVVAAFLMDQVVSCAALPRGFDEAPTATRLLLPSFFYLMQRKMPYMFLAPDLLEAVKLTDYEGDIDWAQLKLPYEHGIFILPRGALRHPKDGDVSMILYSRCMPGTYPPPVVNKGIPAFVIEEAHFCCVALCPENGVWYDFNVTATKRPIIRLNNLFYTETMDGSPAPVLPTYTVLDANLTEEDSGFVEKLGVITFGTLLLMQARPQLLTKEKLLRKVREKKTGDTKEWWEPNIIGKHYRLRSHASSNGHHASPREHWKRGHHKMQAYGPQSSLRKEIWIEPYCVGYKEEKV